MHTSTPNILKRLMEQNEINQPELSKLTGVPQSTIQRILSGAIKSPKTDQLIPICNYFGVTLNQIVGIDKLENNHDNTEEAKQSRDFVPLISWVTAGQFDEAIDLNQTGIAEEYVARINGGKNVYALYVRGDSMTAPTGVTPSFPEGYIIHIDPEQSTSNGDYVIAKINGSNAVTFKQLKHGEQPYLHPLNPDYKPIFDEFRILGKVIGVSFKL